MPYHVEVLSIGKNSDKRIEEVAQILNAVQDEFRFGLPPSGLRRIGDSFEEEKYRTKDLWDFFRDYRAQAKGFRPFLIGVIDAQLDSDKYTNLFGSHRAQGDGLAVVTLRDYHRFADSYRSFLCYYFIRYSLSFVCPALKSHQETRDCFFDFKQNKQDLEKSLRSGAFCSSCSRTLAKTFNEEIRKAINQMIIAMKAQHKGSQDSLKAASLKGSTAVGIITMREDEFEAVLHYFGDRRRAVGDNRYYEHVRVHTKKGEIGVAIARSPEQGQGPANAVAADMISDFSPRWILLVGIAGAMPDSEYALGDVILASRVHDFAVAAALEGGVVEHQQQGGAVHKDVEKLLTHLPALKAEIGDWSTELIIGIPRPVETIDEKTDERFYGDEKWRSRVYNALRAQFPPGRPPRPTVAKVSPMIAGNTLVKDTQLAEKYRTSARHASAIEMELGGVYLAARYRGDGNTRVLAIRGLSDIVGYKRAPEWTAFACRSAASFANTLIRSGILFD
jgi:nucleoside phosphorylase